MIGERIQRVPKTSKCNRKDVLSELRTRMRDDGEVIQEASQAIAIGTEALLTNLMLLLHFAIKNPDCVHKLRQDLSCLDSETFADKVWCDPDVLRLEYLVCWNPTCNDNSKISNKF